MAIPEGYKKNFATLERAFQNGDVCLLECKDKATGKMVIAVCAVDRETDGGMILSPFAKMFDGNPYDELNPPE